MTKSLHDEHSFTDGSTSVQVRGGKNITFTKQVTLQYKKSGQLVFFYFKIEPNVGVDEPNRRASIEFGLPFDQEAVDSGFVGGSARLFWNHGSPTRDRFALGVVQDNSLSTHDGAVIFEADTTETITNVVVTGWYFAKLE